MIFQKTQALIGFVQDAVNPPLLGAAITAASALVYLGSLSVWVIILGLTIKALLALIVLGIVGTVGYIVWKRYGRTIAAE